MALSITEIRRLGHAAGEATASGAFQRLEQAAANFANRNQADPEEVEEFRRAAQDAFMDACVRRQSDVRIFGI